MDREKMYINLGRIERLWDELKVCEENNITPKFSPNDEAYKVGSYAEEIFAYIRANNDFELILDCCRIQRSTLYRFRDEDRDVMSSIGTCRRCLWNIHDFALRKIWKISPQDIKECKYYVNSVTGECRDSETQEIIPIPTEPQQKVDIEKQDVCLDEVADLINEGKETNCVMNLINKQIKNFHNSIGTAQYVEYVGRNIWDKANIWGRGRPILDKGKSGNLWFELDKLKALIINEILSKVDDNRDGKNIPEPQLPDELNTERARKYFVRAVEVDYMEKTDAGYKWKELSQRGSKVKLGYFLQKVYCPTNTEKLPETALNSYFDTIRIGSTISQLMTAVNPQKWRTEIDTKIFLD
ncbi:hypothetical protein LJB92_03930 [Bacteroidales bacterium OttesenSCG-928-M06]|nr:hypothetical protein [Bacteroidales bacterium OttesenSCG-928-M06]